MPRLAIKRVKSDEYMTVDIEIGNATEGVT